MQKYMYKKNILYMRNQILLDYIYTVYTIDISA